MGMQVAIGGIAAVAKSNSSTELSVITPNIPTSGFYEVTLSTPSGGKISVGKVLYSGESCTCECNMKDACEENCSCDPECLICTCDIDTACSANCPCDPECKEDEPSQGCNCSSAPQEKNPIEFIVLFALSILICAYFRLRSRYIG